MSETVRPRLMTPWTRERVDEAVELFTKKKWQPKAIARRLGGVTAADVTVMLHGQGKRVRMCKFKTSVGDDVIVCGSIAVEGQSFCAAHAAMVEANRDRRTRLKRAEASKRGLVGC